MIGYRKRFGLIHHPLPRDACGQSFQAQGRSYEELSRLFSWLSREPGLGLLTGEAGVGKTAAMRHLCSRLPRPDFRVMYICDTATSASAVYRTMAVELGLRPSHQRDALWRQLKTLLAKMADTDGTVPIMIIDEAQHLSDSFFLDLAGFVNYAFDSRDLLTIWLVGLPRLRSKLELRHHSALWTRIVATQEFAPKTRDEAEEILADGLVRAGASTEIIAEGAIEVLWRASRGNMRRMAHLLRSALDLADRRNQNFVDHSTMLAVCGLGRGTAAQPTDQGSKAETARRPPKNQQGVTRQPAPSRRPKDS